jgi:lipopolysaccharide/colanic/teichoic acid biosynthesis glycosyltransferase
VELDLLYLQSRSVKQNISIIARTIPAVLSGKGAY